jgi:anti-sigma-K factor RskA
MNEELEEQASLYVFGLLEKGEAGAFERRLESDAEMRALVDDLDEAAAAIAHHAPARTLPTGLRARVLSQIGGTNKVLTFPLRSAWIPWTLAACLALACAYLVAENSGLRKRVTRLEERDILARLQIASLTSKLANAPNANAVVVWDERKQRGILKITQLPPNADDHDYQLWLVDPRYKNPVDGGVFHVAKDGTRSIGFHPATPVREAKAFAISLERKGGVSKAEGPIVLLGK